MLISQEMLLDVLPRWDAVVRSMNANVAAMQDFGSAVDMFAFALALANSPTGVPDVQVDGCITAIPPFTSEVEVDTDEVPSHLVTDCTHACTCSFALPTAERLHTRGVL